MKQLIRLLFLALLILRCPILAQEPETIKIPIRYSDAVKIQELLKALVPDAQVTVDPRTSTLVVRANPEALSLVREMVLELDRAPVTIGLELKALLIPGEDKNDAGWFSPVSKVSKVSIIEQTKLRELLETPGAKVISSPRIHGWPGEVTWASIADHFGAVGNCYDIGAIFSFRALTPERRILQLETELEIVGVREWAMGSGVQNPKLNREGRIKVTHTLKPGESLLFENLFHQSDLEGYRKLEPMFAKNWHYLLPALLEMGPDKRFIVLVTQSESLK